MKPFKYLVIVVLSLLLIGCGQQSVETVAEGPYNKEFYQVNVDSLKNTIDLKLSDMADSFRLVKLETNENCLISANNYYVGDKYIIAFSQNGYYKFSSDGKFLKKILSYGRGPNEVSGFAYTYFYDENTDLLYLGDDNLSDKYLVYDMDSDQFLEPVKMSKKYMGQFTVYNDSLLAGISKYRGDSFSLLFQTFDGELISEIPKNKLCELYQRTEPVFQLNSLTLSKNDIRIGYYSDDTLFTLKNNRLEPYIILDFDTPRNDPPKGYQEVGDRDNRFPVVEPSSFYIIPISVMESLILYTPTAGVAEYSRRYLFLDKYTGEWYLINSYQDDFSGEIQIPNENKDEMGRIFLPIFQKNDKLVVAYEPNTIKKIVEQNSGNQFSSPEFYEELIEISNDLDEMDNPVLLVGDIKPRI
jgi:hypothetical protein